MKRFISLLLSLLMMTCAWGTLAEQSIDMDALMLSWKDSYLTEAEEIKRLSQEDALRIAAGMLLQMDYVTTDSLSLYQPSFVLDNDKNWIVSFQPTELFSDMEPYHVEVNAGDGVVISMVIGANRYLPALPMEPRVLTVLETIRREPVSTESLDDFLRQMTIKLQEYGGWTLPAPTAGTPYLAPDKNDISQGDAFRLATQSLLDKENRTLEELTEYNILFALAADEDERHVWTVRFYPYDLMNDKQYYVITIDAVKAETINIEAVVPSQLPKGIADDAAYDTLVQEWIARSKWLWDIPADDGFNDSPKGSEIGKEPALRMAVEAVLKQQDWPLDLLYAYVPNLSFYQIENGMDNIAPNQRAWSIIFSMFFKKSLPGMIKVAIDAPSHTITDYAVYHNQFTTEPMSSNISTVQQNEAIRHLMDGWIAGKAAFEPTEVPFDGSQPQLGMSHITFAMPQPYDMPLVTALRLAVDAIMQFQGIEAEALAVYKPIFRLCASSADSRYWSILFEGVEGDPSLLMTYLVEVKSPSGLIQKVHAEQVK